MALFQKLVINNYLKLQETATKFHRTIQRKFEGLDKLSKKFENWDELSYAELIKEPAKKKFKLIATPWLLIHEDGSLAELTPTLKLKRRVIREKYSKEIAAIYEEAST